MKRTLFTLLSLAFLTALISPVSSQAQTTAYVTNFGSDNVTPIDIATNTAGTPIPVGIGPHDIAITPDGATAYVANRDGNNVTPITIATNTPGTLIPVGTLPYGIAITPDGATAYVTNYGSDSVTPIDVATNTPGTPIVGGFSSPVYIATTPDGTTAYVTNRFSNNVTPITVATNTPGTLIPVGSSAVGIAITPDGATAYVANFSSNTVTPITIATNTAGVPIVVGSSPRGIAITPDGATAYVANFVGNNVTPVTIATNTAGVPIAVGSGPYDIAITPDGATAYVTNIFSNNVTPIDLTSNPAIPGTPIAVGTNPWRIAITPSPLNQPPTVGAVTVPTDPIDINDQPVTGVSADFSDPDANDTHTCTVDYDDGTGPQVGTVNGATCEGPDQTYAEAGVYEVTVEVTDDDGGSGSATATTFIVIYDPADGFVTGGGWIDSPPGACPVFCDDATGTANFGFVSKYKRGREVPEGQTEFNFSAGDLNFHSMSYDWLVIAGAKAMYRGEGTVNGDAGFTFQINAIDGSRPGGGDVDKFRIKIKAPGGGVIYDNQMGAGDNDDPTTALGGGQIKIHTGGGGRHNPLMEGEGAVTEVTTGVEVPDTFALYGSYPNPFNPATTLRYDVPESARVRLAVFDVLGRGVIRLVDGAKEPGRYEVIFDASALPSGVYFARFTAGTGFAQTQRMTLLK